MTPARNPEGFFSGFYCDADEYSEKWQRRYLWSERIALGAMVAAAVLAVGPNGWLWAVAAMFVIAVFANIYQLLTRAERRWWNGRAGAESAKTLCWRYVVGGRPLDVLNVSAAVELSDRFREIATKVAEFAPIPVPNSHVTEEMRQLRARPLTERIADYQKWRIRGQMTWYSSKSGFNERWSNRWTFVALVAQGSGLVLAVLAINEQWSVDFIGVFSALGASALAWSATKQHDVLARSYANASSELASIDTRISEGSWDEASWAQFVDESEEAISREHTSWRASRAV